jgi:phenylalanine ammonia-lyase
LVPRSNTAVRQSVGTLLTAIGRHVTSVPAGTTPPSLDVLVVANAYQVRAALILRATYEETRAAFFVQPTTSRYLSDATRAIFNYVREDLRVPFHRGLVDHPTLVADEIGRHGEQRDGSGDEKGSRRGRLLGSMASEIYVAVRNGGLHRRVVTAWERAMAVNSSPSDGGVVGDEVLNGKVVYGVAIDGSVTDDSMAAMANGKVLGNGH